MFHYKLKYFFFFIPGNTKFKAKMLIQGYFLLMVIHMLRPSSAKSQESPSSQICLKVKIDTNYFSHNHLSEIFRLNFKVLCGGLWAERPNCNIWCHSGLETLGSIVLSPHYIETSKNYCYTRRRSDLAVGATTCSSPLKSPEKGSWLSVDGIFLDGFGYVFTTKEVKDPWVGLLLDLKRPTTIFEIIINSTKACDFIDIKIGEQSLNCDGNFYDYQLFDNTNNVCDSYPPGHFKSSNPMTGQFVAIIRRLRSSDLKKLIINYIEIIGEWYLIN